MQQHLRQHDKSGHEQQSDGSARFRVLACVQKIVTICCVVHPLHVVELETIEIV